MIDITKENKIRQEIRLELIKGSQEYGDFLSVLKGFIEKHLREPIEGDIDSISISDQWSSRIDLRVKTVKEDRLKMIESAPKETQ